MNPTMSLKMALLAAAGLPLAHASFAHIKWYENILVLSGRNNKPEFRRFKFELPDGWTVYQSNGRTVSKYRNANAPKNEQITSEKPPNTGALVRESRDKRGVRCNPRQYLRDATNTTFTKKSRLDDVSGKKILFRSFTITDATCTLKGGSTKSDPLVCMKSIKCPDCDATGFKGKRQCSRCKGETTIRSSEQFDEFEKACREWAPFFIDDTMKCRQNHPQDRRGFRDLNDPNRFDLKCSVCFEPLVKKTKKRRRRLGYQWLAPVAAS